MDSSWDCQWFSVGADAQSDAPVVIASKTSGRLQTPSYRPSDHQWLEPWRFRTKAKPRGKSSNQPWMACSREEAKPYKRYKKLYGERKFARDFPTQKQNLSFSDDLPVEIRLQVYEHLFNVPDNFFELWAPKEWTRGRGHWAKNSFRQFARQKHGLRVMRLCKKIHEEVSDHFYGGNNFRFTNFDGFLVMAAFNHTIRPASFSFLKHITVQIPNRVHDGSYDEGMDSKTGWREFDRLLARRGMRVPDYRLWTTRGKHSFRVQGEGGYTYNQAVLKGFRQLRNMPNLKLLEVTIPWDYRFSRESWYVTLTPEEEATQCNCPAEHVEAMSPGDRIRHTIEGHCRDPEYLALLADLKENAASGDLTVALVIHYGSTRETPEEILQSCRGLDNLRQARWVAAYAALMGYRFGHARWETEGPRRGTYQVRYDEDPMLALVREGRAENSLLEPPELPEYQEEEAEAEAAEVPA